ncbi:hypothetical protein RN001_007458 [Aquatica leii]|uniref:Phosphatidate cytidylyltransferase, mitochondrial n=1 Tax=Aquatica leii TaxID=1421715 RepID=A0AAN7P8C4_9COLE|nr:hypothetical protein RN001_007458 [Aquatica leii]
MASLKTLIVAPTYMKILSKFPSNFSFCFAYGSAVKKQLNNTQTPANSNMIDLVFCVDNAYEWHRSNLEVNRSHYSGFRYLGHHTITNFQEHYGAKVYFNTLVPLDDIIYKYGVISTKDLITDLLEWSDLYLAGRLHKPVEIIIPPTSSELQTALQLNLQSAVHAALLILPETFTEYQFYHTICNLSYAGDFRMFFGENKNKVDNIVKPQILQFRTLYKLFMKNLHDYVDFPLPTEDAKTSDVKTVICSQDIRPLARLHHLNQLPRWPQKALTKYWNRGSLRQDTEDVLRAIAYDPDCNVTVVKMSYIGPTLPPHLLKKSSEDDENQDEVETVLPQKMEEFESDKTENVYGPALPAHLKNNDSSSSDDAYGPALPSSLKNVPVEDSFDDDAYGPLPVDVASNSIAHRALEERALQIKLGYLDNDRPEPETREKWMIELPEVKASKLGLGPRQFRKNAGPDMSDRSSWTDTPEEKAKKRSKKTEVPVDLKREAELKEIRKRDAEQAHIAERHSSKKKRDKSLLDMHQDELKKKKLESSEQGEPTRRPFNREIDLKVNQFDDAQKKSIIKKAMHLDDRFSSGQSKFL